MRIQVLRDFAGKLTNEQRIYPGQYELGDDALFGAGQYLLDNGFAVISDDAVAEAEIETQESHAVDYSDWTVSALKDELEARGIDIDALEGSGAGGKLLKDDLVTVLEGDDADAREPQNETIEFNGRTIDAQAPEAD